FGEAVVPFLDDEASPPSKHALREDLNRYASYCVELEEYEGCEADVRARYGVASAEEHEAIGRGWNARLGTDAELRVRFYQAIKTYRDWLRTHRQGGKS